MAFQGGGIEKSGISLAVALVDTGIKILITLSHLVQLPLLVNSDRM
jgi:hypothetical protein